LQGGVRSVLSKPVASYLSGLPNGAWSEGEEVALNYVVAILVLFVLILILELLLK
jgi:hypothetical protein